MKKFLLSGVVIICGILFTACANGAGNAGTDAPSAGGAVTTANTAAADTADAAGEDPAEGVQPAKMVYGEISEVIGNALVIKEIEMPERREMGEAIDFEGMTEFTLPDGTVVPIGEDGKPDFSSVEMPEGMTRIDNGDGAMMFQMTPGDGAGDVQSGAAPSGEMRQIRAPEQKYTGEEMEIIIPVGVPIMTRTRGESGMEETELALSDVKSGNIITITYKEDAKTIDTVFVSQSGGGFAGGMPGMGGDNFFMQSGSTGEGNFAIITREAP